MSAPQRPAAPYAFVSYASVDRERVLPVVEALERAGVPVWIDRQGIAGGESYGLEIAEAIEGCAAFVLMCSAASLASRNVRQEIALAWKYARPYVPLLLEPVTVPKEVEYWLEAAQWVEVLEKPAAQWLPPTIAALAAHGLVPAPPAPGPHEQLVGREREQGLLRDRLNAALAGRGGLALVGGEAGVGKTALAEATLAEAAARGALVLVGRCYDLSETPPYGPWAELTRAYPAAELPPLPVALTRRDALDAIANQAALFEQMVGWFAAIAAARPLVILLDDLHWADPASLDLLRVAARHAHQVRLLLLVTYRSDEVPRHHPLYTHLPLLDREAHALRLELRRLGAADLRALVDVRYALPEGDAARLAAWLLGRAEGNAFFSAQLLRSLEDAGVLSQAGDAWALGDLAAVGLPAPLRQVIDGRLARLGEEAQHLLTLAAVIGQEVPLALWATVAETDEEGLLDTLERAVEARLLIEVADGSGMRFAHTLIRDALYAGLLVTRRRRLHGRVGEALLAAADPDPDAVAYHLRQAGDPRAADWLIRAGARAQRLVAYQTAMQRYEAALTLCEAAGAAAATRGWLRFRLGLASFYPSPKAAVAHMEEAAHLGTAAGDRALTGNATFWLGAFHAFSGSLRQGLEELESATAMLASLLPVEQEHLRARAIDGALDGEHATAHLVFYLALAGRFARARELGEPLLAGDGQVALDPNARAAVGRGLGLVYAALGEPDAALAAQAIARAAARAARNHSDFALIALDEVERVRLPFQADRAATWVALADEAERPWPDATGTHTGDVFIPNVTRLPLLLLAGAWDRALALAQPGLAIGGGGMYRRLAGLLLVPLALWQGDTARGVAIVRELLPMGAEAAPGSDIFLSAVALQCLAGDLALAGGDHAGAHAWLACHDRWMRWSGAVAGQAEGQLGWAAYHRATGDYREARACAERALAHATSPRQPLALLAAHRLLGELDTAEGGYERAAMHLADALALADACAAAYERALTLLALAELRAAGGQGSAARELLAEARGICEPLGAQPALDRAAALAASLTPDA